VSQSHQCLRATIEISTQDVEILTGILWESGTSGWEEIHSGTFTTLVAYFPGESIEALLSRLKMVADRSGLELQRLDVEIFGYDEQGWIRSYRLYFTSFAVGDSFWIHPEWESPSNRRRINLLIHPGHAFGTGTHESTRLCLLFLESLAEGAESILDFGTGSGILAIAARRFNPRARITAFDIDPQAVDFALEMADMNRVSEIDFFAGSASSLHTSYDLVLANLTAAIHRRESADLKRLAGRHLVLSGITGDQVEYTLEAFTGPEFRLLELREENGWSALHLERNPDAG